MYGDALWGNKRYSVIQAQPNHLAYEDMLRKEVNRFESLVHLRLPP